MLTAHARPGDRPARLPATPGSATSSSRSTAASGSFGEVVAELRRRTPGGDDDDPAADRRWPSGVAGAGTASPSEAIAAGAATARRAVARRARAARRSWTLPRATGRARRGTSRSAATPTLDRAAHAVRPAHRRPERPVRRRRLADLRPARRARARGASARSSRSASARPRSPTRCSSWTARRTRTRSSSATSRAASRHASVDGPAAQQQRRPAEAATPVEPTAPLAVELVDAAPRSCLAVRLGAGARRRRGPASCCSARCAARPRRS